VLVFRAGLILTPANNYSQLLAITRNLLAEKQKVNKHAGFRRFGQTLPGHQYITFDKENSLKINSLELLRIVEKWGNLGVNYSQITRRFQVTSPRPIPMPPPGQLLATTRAARESPAINGKTELLTTTRPARQLQSNRSGNGKTLSAL
jgi:hypothetical protein